MPSKYVSAEWVVDEIMGTRMIKAIGDDGSVWWIGELNSDVPPWPQFLEEHGEAAIKEPAQAKAPAKPPASKTKRPPAKRKRTRS